MLPSVSVGFLIYNEEKTVEEVLRQAHQLLSQSEIEYEILVCDDGSTDHSLDIIENFAKKHPHFRIINHSRNLGIHAALEDLYKNAKNDFVFINAVDKQWKTGILFDMLPLTKDADIIIASRKKKPYGLFRSFVSWGFNKASSVLFGVDTFDAGSVKLIKREIIERFPLISKSPFSEAERIIRASKAGYRIIDYPVRVFPRKTGRASGVKPKVLLGAFIDVFRVWYSLHCRRGAT